MGWPRSEGPQPGRTGGRLSWLPAETPAPASSKGSTFSAARRRSGLGKLAPLHPRPSHVQAPPAAAPSPWRPVPTSPPPAVGRRGLRRSPAAASVRLAPEQDRGCGAHQNGKGEDEEVRKAEISWILGGGRALPRGPHPSLCRRSRPQRIP